MYSNDARIGDLLYSSAGYGRPLASRGYVMGHGMVEVFDEDGNLKQTVNFKNLITQVGDQYYGERAASGISGGFTTSVAQATGMQLGTGTTAVAKTGAGAAVVTYINSSAKAFDSGFPASTLSGSSRRIQWKCTWAAGEATANGISEVVLINQAVATNSAAAAANTIARALISPVVNKAAGDTLAITWNHDLLGA